MVMEGVPSEVRDELTVNAARRQELKAKPRRTRRHRFCIPRWPTCTARKGRRWSQALEQPETHVSAMDSSNGRKTADIDPRGASCDGLRGPRPCRLCSIDVFRRALKASAVA